MATTLDGGAATALDGGAAGPATALDALESGRGRGRGQWGRAVSRGRSTDGEGADLAAAVAREGSGCYFLKSLRRARRGGRTRLYKHKTSGADAAPPPKNTILKRLPPMDLASLAPRLGLRGAATGGGSGGLAHRRPAVLGGRRRGGEGAPGEVR